jgi:hypothetical protein
MTSAPFSTPRAWPCVPASLRHARHGILQRARDGARSFACYSRESDIDALVAALAQAREVFG